MSAKSSKAPSTTGIETTTKAKSTPTAGQLKKVAERFAAAGDAVQAEHCDKAASAAARASDPDSPIAGLQQAARRAKAEGDLAQAEKFIQATRHLGAEPDDAIEGILKTLRPSKQD